MPERPHCPTSRCCVHEWPWFAACRRPDIKPGDYAFVQVDEGDFGVIAPSQSELARPRISWAEQLGLAAGDSSGVANSGVLNSALQLWQSGTAKPKHLAEAKLFYAWHAKNGVEAGVIKSLNSVTLFTSAEDRAGHIEASIDRQTDTSPNVFTRLATQTLREDPGFWLRPALAEASRFRNRTGLPWSIIICAQSVADIEIIVEWINANHVIDQLTGHAFTARGISSADDATEKNKDDFCAGVFSVLVHHNCGGRGFDAQHLGVSCCAPLSQSATTNRTPRKGPHRHTLMAM